jgi:hypothetical protein
LAYIGTKPTIGNFQICDAISVVNGQAAYTMQVGGVNVSPQSSNHMIVSLNGTIQKPNSSFTVSGSTITFASNLATGDVIDFIQILGDVLDLGVPSDATVTAAKLASDSVTSAKVADGVLQPPHRNIIINGDMSIAQRTTSASSLTSSGYHALDRFRCVIVTAGTWTISQSTTVPSGQGFANSMKWDNTTADGSLGASDFVSVQQFIEGQNLQYLKKGTSSAESLTVSFWVRSNKTGTYILELKDNDNTRAISQSYTISSADTWEKKTLTFAGDTTGTLDNDSNASFLVQFALAAGSDYTSGSLQTSWGAETTANRYVGQVNLADSTSNEWYMTGLQVEVGTAASDFEFLPFDVNLQRCFRYYQKSYSYATAPGTNTTNGLHTTDGSAGGLTTGYLYGDIDFKVAMRAAPTVTLYDKGGNSGVCARLNSGVSRTDSQNCSAGDIIEKGFSLTSTGTANAGAIDVHFEATAEL